MATVQQQARKMRDIMTKHRDSAELPGNIGFKLPNGNYSPQGDDTNIALLPFNKAYVRLLGEDAQTQVALIGPVTLWPDLPVMVKRNFRGELVITRLDESRAAEYLNEQMRDFQSPPKSGAGYDVFKASQLTDGRIYWADTTALTVKVQAFYYPYLDSIKKWAGLTSLDLADYLPATSSAWSWVVVCIDPRDNTITGVQGSEYSVKLSLDTADLLSIDTSGLIPVAGVTVQEAQTAYNKAKNTIEYLPVIHHTNNGIVATTYGTGLIGSGHILSVPSTVTVTGVLEVKGELIAA